jgi:hypothetical protein
MTSFALKRALTPSGKKEEGAVDEHHTCAERRESHIARIRAHTSATRSRSSCTSRHDGKRSCDSHRTIAPGVLSSHISIWDSAGLQEYILYQSSSHHDGILYFSSSNILLIYLFQLVVFALRFIWSVDHSSLRILPTAALYLLLLPQPPTANIP